MAEPRPLSAAELEPIVQEVMARLPGATRRPVSAATPGPGADGPGLHHDLDSAFEAADRAFHELHEISLEQRRELIGAMRQTVREEAVTLARMAVEETGLGRADDKVQKNLLVGEKTPGVEILEPHAVTGDHGLMLQELAPWGTIAAITPSTNPTETIICNGIGMIAAGNAVVFCPHPLAKRASAHIIAALNRAIAKAGGPATLLNGLVEPSIEFAQSLMRHPRAAMVVVTGGPGVVREAMKSGKRVIAAGPGNPPVVVDETAEIEAAGRDIVLGASLDNNIICTDEKEAFVVASVADKLKSAMEASGGWEIHGPQIDRMAELVLTSRDGSSGLVNKDWVGKDAVRLLDAIGVRPSRDVRLVFAEVDPDHPFVWTELLMPVFPIVRVKTAEEAMDLAIAAEKGCRHTATMHSQHVSRLSQMARRLNCSIFVKNGPAYAGLGMGGEGYASFTIAGPTGEGMTTARDFARLRRCTLVDSFRIV